MVRAMVLDRGQLPRVVWLVTMIGCAPSFRPPAPPDEPTPGIKVERPHVAPANPGNETMVAEICPNGAGGRAGIAPVVVRTVGWSDNATDLDNMIERGAVPRFGVYGVDGKLAGAFDTMGLDEGAPVATGTYAGGAPCSADAGKGNPRTDDGACAKAFNGCGLAVAMLARPDDPPEVPQLPTGGACLSGDALAVDIDGDGVPEQFPVAQILDGIRGPASEWTANAAIGAKCTPSFQLYNVRLEQVAKGKVDEKATVWMDLLGVVDLDNDGKKELVIALRFPTVRSIVVFGTTDIPQRLQLLGEASGFPR